MTGDGDANAGEPKVSFRADAHTPPDAPPEPPPPPLRRSASSLVQCARVSLTHLRNPSYAKFDEMDETGLVEMQALQAACRSEKSRLVAGHENRVA